MSTILRNSITKFRLSKLFFLKPNSAISDQIILASKETLHYETEICFLIKNNKIAGLGIGLDLTKRAIQSEFKAKGLPWERAKAFDHSAVLSDFIPWHGSTDQLRLELRINDQHIQSGGVELMIYKPQELLGEIQSFMSLEDGDIIMTGTPKGVGTIQTKDVFGAKLYNAEQVLLKRTWLAN